MESDAALPVVDALIAAAPIAAGVIEAVPTVVSCPAAL